MSNVNAEQAQTIVGDMTEAELAALAELDEQMEADGDEPEFDPAATFKPGDDSKSDDGKDNDDEEEEEQEEEIDPATTDPKKADEKVEPRVDEKVDDTPEEDDEQDEEVPHVPLMVANKPEDYDDQVKAIADAKGALADKFDDGDMTAKEYQTELDKLNSAERKLERIAERFEMAQDLENQRVTNNRMGEINRFLKSVDIPHDPANLKFSVLDQAVRRVAVAPEMATASATAIMKKAYQLCVDEGVLQAKAKDQKADHGKKVDDPAKPPVKPRKEIKAPPTLATLPASGTTDTESNQFAHLNRMHPDAREAAFNKMTPAQQDAYLAAGS